MAVCPWFSQKRGVGDPAALMIVLGAGVGFAAAIFAMGYRQPLALVASAAGIMIAVSVVLVFFRVKGLRSFRPAFGAYGVHLGVAMMVVGGAFSAAYQMEADAVLHKGGNMTVGGYTLVYEGLRHDHDNPAMDVHEARLTVTRDGRPVGVLTPEKRLYRNFEQSSFTEVSVIQYRISERTSDSER